MSCTCCSELPGVFLFLLPVWEGVLTPAGWLQERMPVSLWVSSSSMPLKCNSAWPKHLFEQPEAVQDQKINGK